MEPTTTLAEIPIDLIAPNLGSPRKVFNPETLNSSRLYQRAWHSPASSRRPFA